MMDIPKDKNYPPAAAQCDGCGGNGCAICSGRGWLARSHPRARRCERNGCRNFIPPAQIAVYCSVACAAADA